VDLLERSGVGAPRGGGVSVRALARLAREHDLLSDETLAAIEGLSVLRNLAAHSPTDGVGFDRAQDYLALADAVLYAMRPKPANGTSSSTAVS
jgi:hypothetical protein